MQDQFSASPAQSPPEEQRETRQCRSCMATGWIMLDAEYDPTSGELTEESAECPICKGVGSRSVFMYRTLR